MPRPTFQSRLMDELHEAQQAGLPLQCKECHELFPFMDAITSAETCEVFCSQACCDRYEAEYHAYIERASAQAAREFRNRTPEAKRQHTEWNVWADTMSAATA